MSLSKSFNLIYEQNKDHESVEASHEQKLIEEENKEQLGVKLNDSLKELPQRQQEAIVLKFFGELSYKEISNILEINEQSARNLIQRGLDHIRKNLKSVVIIILTIINNLFN